MKYLLWYWFEGRPSARLKLFVKRLSYRLEGERQQRKMRRELYKLELERPKYEIPKSLIIKH